MSIVSEIAGLLPPNLRRTVAGAWLDLKSLPDRLRNPARWGEPLQTIHNVGGGDFDQAGKALLDQLATFASLSSTSDVLDIGCGTGRLAKPLSEYLQLSSTYIGFDVSLTAIVSCRRRIGRASPNFTFVKADIANHEYNPLGRISEAEYCFPANDESIDVVAAFSVFSHMVQASIDRYLLEAHRVLRSGGSFAFTAYALTPERIEAINRGEGRFRFRPWSDGAMVLDHRSPERAIAHPLDHLVSAITASGLRLQDGFQSGNWLGSSTYDGFQDLFILTKA